MFDLHTHVLPGVDDGVRSIAEAQRVIAALGALGCEGIVATPHIRMNLFPNQPPALRARFSEVHAELVGELSMQLVLAAEHHVDEGMLTLQAQRSLMTYPDGSGVLIELPYDRVVPSFDDVVFRLSLAGYAPILAHPERCRALRESAAPWPYPSEAPRMLLDVRALTGAYGRDAESTCKAWLHAGHYFAACTDSHNLDDVAASARAIETLRSEVGAAAAHQLLHEAPRTLFAQQPTR